jgi:hypothetical protein
VDPVERTNVLLTWLSPLSRSLEEDTPVYVFALVLLYLLLTFARATGPFGYDELFTFYIARMKTVSGGWAAVVAGADLQPPLSFAAVHASQKLFGASELATRLPSILGFLVASLCLFWFLRRRIGPIFALCGSALMPFTGAYIYSYWARPYSLVLAGAALALLCWQAATDFRWRPVSLIGISVGLGIALMSSCYAVLLAIPFGTGEITRSVVRRRIDWPLWLAFFMSALALTFYPPLFRSHEAFTEHIGLYKSTPASLVIAYRDLLGTAIFAIGLGLAAVTTLRCQPSPLRQKATGSIPTHEFVALVGFASLPVFVFCAAAAVQSFFFLRYGLTAVLGITALLAHLFYRAASRDVRMGSLLVLVCAGSFIGIFIADYNGAQAPSLLTSAAVTSERAAVPGHPLLSLVPDGDIPLVTADAHDFLQVDHYAPPSLAGRLFYLADSAFAGRYTGDDIYEAIYARGLPWFPIRGHFVPYASFLRNHEHFFVYASKECPFEWLLAKLGDDQVRLRFIARSGHNVLFEAFVHDSGQ